MALTLDADLYSLLASVQSALTVPVARASLAPGTSPAWDDCCDGQLWVRVTSIAPTATAARSPCAVLYKASLSVGVIRCAAVLDDQGNAPPVSALNADTEGEVRDMHDIAVGVLCNPLKFTLGIWTPLGVEGGCVGGEWSLDHRFTICPDCERMAA